MLNLNRQTPKPISKFAILLGVIAGMMASSYVARHKISNEFLDNLADAIMWGGIFLVLIFICRYSLRRFKFFSVHCDSIDTKSALVGAFVCMFVCLVMIF